MRARIVVRLEPAGVELTGAPGERLLDLADELDRIVLPSACRAANCGACVLRVLQGLEVLEPPEPRETQTLRDLGLDAGVRLGCQIELARAGSTSPTLVVLRVP